jgi:hypothetical protein
LAKDSEGINFPSMNNIDSELRGSLRRQVVKPVTGSPFGDLLIHLLGLTI